MKNFGKLLAITLFLGIIAITVSCQKADTELQPNDTSASADDALAESMYDNATNIANEAYERGADGLKSTDQGYFLSGCATVTLDTTSMPHELTIDFGEENCLCQDGRYRRGKILVTFNGGYWWPGTVITYGFDNYFVDDNQIDGTKVVTNMGFVDGIFTWNIEVLGIINFANGGTLTWNSSTQRMWVSGITTPLQPLDDVYHITGSSEGIRPSGETWTKQIVDPLKVVIGCRWIVSGTMEIAPQGLPIRYVDWGDGECDNIMTVTVNGVTYTILLP